MNDLLPGTEVQARGLRWQLVSCDQQHGRALYRLRGLGGTVAGQEIELLDGLDEIQPIRHDVDPQKAGRLREWLLYHEAFVLEQALGPHALLAVQPGRLEIQPYQLVPVIRALSMSRVRLLLADGVGLGKTVQAGLVMTELMARRLVQRVLVISPAGPLLEQWRTEMRDRFGLRLQVVDRAKLEEVRRQTELGANPFDHLPLSLTSIDFVKQERVLAELERSAYDLVIIDEAHHCVDPGASALADDSLRRRVAQVLAGRTDSLLLLTATPHDGNDRSFASLCELLDPSLVDGRGVVRGDRYRRHVVRRLKRHVRDAATGKPLFPERKVLPQRIVVDPARHKAFADLTRGLLALIAPELRRAIRDKRYSDVLSFFALLKRSVSTAAACRSTLEVVADRFDTAVADQGESQEARRERIRTLRDARRRLDRFGVGTADEESEIQALEVEDIAQQLAELERAARTAGRRIDRSVSIRDSLRSLVTLAKAAELADPKLDELISQIQTIRAPLPTANILIYTEYTTSQNAVAERLKREGLLVLTLSGNDSEKVRLETTDRFRTTHGLIMVCTDAAAEGLNLHQQCHNLIHLELPFNPNRLEQRNGRIDRYGQKYPPIVRYLHLAGTFEENILLRLIAKYERQRAMLTFVPNTLGVTASPEHTAGRLLQGIIDSEGSLFSTPAPKFTLSEGDPADGAGGAVTELLEEIDRSFSSFEKAAKTNTWLADAGSFAEEAVTREAQTAKTEGDRAADIDLARFVVGAILRDGGDLRGKITDQTFEVRLPGAWGVDLNDTPGAEPESRSARVTVNKDVLFDAQKRPVGFLGRSHPLVRHAIDRVRHTSLGEGAGNAGGIDPRASAVAGAVTEPALICTFLARIMSGAGRELERVVSVSVTQGKPPKYSEDPHAWLAAADPDRAINPTGIWDKHFARWVGGATDLTRTAGVAAATGFMATGQAFIKEARMAVANERAELERWLGERASDLIPGATQKAEQPALFDAKQPKQAKPAAAPATTPLEKLQRLRGDANQSTKFRSEVEAVLKTYHSRLDRLNARQNLSEPEITPLGILMVVPEALSPAGGKHGA